MDRADDTGRERPSVWNNIISHTKDENEQHIYFLEDLQRHKFSHDII